MTKGSGGNSHEGLFGWSVGLVGFALTFFQPAMGLILGVVGLVINNNQNKKSKTAWSETGRKLSITAIIVSVILLVLVFVAASYLQTNPELLSQLGGLK
jgi:hypothetical protein